jgi:TolB protein
MKQRFFALERFDRVAIVLIAAFLLGSVAVALVSDALATSPGKVGGDSSPRLLYLHDLDLGHWQLFTLALDTGEIVQLADTQHGVLDYDVNAEGTRVAYAAMREDGGADLWVTGVDGSGRRRLLACPEAQCSAPDWSPGGRLIAYERREAAGSGFGDPRIWLLELDSGDTWPLFASEDKIGSSPRWSPDARRARLAYVDETESAVYVYNLGDGSLALIPVFSDLPPVWAPAGDRLLVTDLRMMGGQIGDQLWVADTDSDSLVNVSGGESALVQDMWPAWSPSGEQIAFTRQVLAGAGVTGGRQLWLMRHDGSEMQMLTIDATATFSQVVWRPDGGALAYVRRTLSDPGARPELWLMELPDGKPVLLAETSTAPTWLP